MNSYNVRTAFNCENFLNPKLCDKRVIAIYLQKQKYGADAIDFIQSEYEAADEVCSTCRNFKLKSALAQ